MKVIGEIIREEMKKAGITQDQLGRIMGVDRSLISKYINGHIKLTDQIIAEIADAIDSPLLMILAAGTTSISRLVFDQVKVDFYITGMKAIEEMEEAIEDIKKVMQFAYNIDTIEDLSQEQRKAFEHMLDEVEDANHALDMLDMAAKKMGADLKARNKRCLLKYQAKGYISDRIREIVEGVAG